MAIPTADELKGYVFHCRAVRATIDPAGPFAVEDVPQALQRAARAAKKRGDMHWKWSYDIYSRGYAVVARAVHDALACAGMQLDGWVRDLLLKATTMPELDDTGTAVRVDGVWFEHNPDAARWHAAWVLLHAPFLDDVAPLARALDFCARLADASAA